MTDGRTIDARAMVASQVLHDNIFRALEENMNLVVGRAARLDMVKSGAMIIEICLRLDPDVDASETMERLKEFQEVNEDEDENGS